MKIATSIANDGEICQEAFYFPQYEKVNVQQGIPTEGSGQKNRLASMLARQRGIQRSVLGADVEPESFWTQGVVLRGAFWDYTSMLIGYAYSSTTMKSLSLQEDVLKEAGCQMIFIDKAGSKPDRIYFEDALGRLHRGDTFVVCSLNELGLAFEHLVETVIALQEAGIQSAPLRNTSTPC